MKNKIVFLFLVLFFISGCTTQNISQSSKIDVNEGILFSSISCSKDITWIELYPVGAHSKGYSGLADRAAVITCPHQEKDPYKTIALKAGTYFIGKIGSNDFVDIKESDAIKLRVEDQKLNYIGDINIQAKKEGLDYDLMIGFHKQTVAQSINVVDKEKDAKQFLKDKKPWLFEKYIFLKAIPK